MTPQYEIQVMNRDQLALAGDWAAAEGWNPGLHDAERFLAADPGGFLIGLLDGQPIASISKPCLKPPACIREHRRNYPWSASSA
jgi:hypothetical protein